jgi:predicted lipoprotein
VPWEQAEAFLFGPVSELGLDPALDSWPVDAAQLEEVLESDLALTPETMDTNLGGGLKGFHTIEFLLWGKNHDKTVAAYQARPREIDYLAAATRALERDSTTLDSAWRDGFGQEMEQAGQGSGRYFSQADAIAQFLNGMIEICDEIANGKIADPYKEHDPALVESQFSYNSIQDFADNLRSILFVYNGARAEVRAPASIAAFVAEQAPEADAALFARLTRAIDDLYAISADGEPFRDAINNPAKYPLIEAAQASIREVMTTLQGEIMPLVRL